MAAAACFDGASLVNNTCLCPPGSFYASNQTCVSFVPKLDRKAVPEVVDFTFIPKFDASIFKSDNSLGQTFFIILTVVTLGVWLLTTLSLRLFPLRGVWFTLRRYVSLVDYAFSKKHWIDEQKVQVKRKTELGGMLSIGAFIFIIGICLGIVYQFFNNKRTAIQNIVPTTGQDVQTFKNDLLFNVTAVSNMKCSQWVAPDVLIVGSAFFTLRGVPINSVANITCEDTPSGPRVSTFCPMCQIKYDNYYFGWSFIDIPEQNLYASAVGFEFTVVTTASSKSRQSQIVGKVQAGSNGTYAYPSTLRGSDSSVLNIRFIPRVFQEDNDLKLVQAAFHEFVTGPYFTDEAELQASIKAGNNSVNFTVASEVLSSYIVETTVGQSMGVLTFLSRIGGIYQLGILLFFFSLNMSERWITFLRYDDKLLNRLERQRLARYRWRKLAIAVRLGLVTGKFGRIMGVADHSANVDVEKSSEIGDEAVMESTRSIFGKSGRSLRKLEAMAQSKRVPVQKPVKKAAGGGWFKGIPGFRLPPNRASPQDQVAISDSMERKAREDILSKNPDVKLQPEAEVKIEVEPEEQAAEIQKSRSFPEKVGKGIVTGIRATGQVGSLVASAGGNAVKMIAKPFGPGAAAEGNPTQAERSDVLESVTEDENKEEEKKKKKKQKRRDTRLGSTSEHKGSVIRRFRNPSWIQDYEMLPAVPDIGEEEERKRQELKRAEEEERKKRLAESGGDHELLPEAAKDEIDSDSDELVLDPTDIYNYLIELHDYQARLRIDFLAAQSMLENVVQRFRPHSDL